MQETKLACVTIYRPEYILSEDLGILNYTSNPTKPRAKFMVTRPTNVNAAPPNDMVL
jgi:hypothetical protein